MTGVVAASVLAAIFAFDMATPHLPGAFRFDPSASVDVARPAPPVRMLVAMPEQPSPAGPAPSVRVERRVGAVTRPAVPNPSWQQRPWRAPTARDIDPAPGSAEED